MSAHAMTQGTSGLLDLRAPKSLQGAAPVARLLSRDECQTLAQKLLSYATAEETRVVIQSEARGNTRFAVNQVSTAGDSYDAAVSVRSTFGKRAASATTNKLDDASLRAVVQRAEALARLAPEDPEWMGELGPQQYGQSRAFADATAALDAAGRAAAVRAITGPARAADLVATGYLETNTSATALANSRGLFAYDRSSGANLTTTIRTPDGTGSGWAGANHFDASRIDAAALGARAMEKARLSRTPVAIEPGRYTVVLEPTAVGNLLQLMAFAMQARAADEGRSFFTKPGGGNKIGMKVIDERVTITSDPMDPDAPAGAFADAGLPTRPVTWIEKGVVKNLAYDRYWAQKQGKEPVPFVPSLRMSGGTQSVEELIAGTERGLLITRLWYIRPVDPRTILYTGLTRDGTFLIERGKITKAVKNLRWNESPVFMLNNLEAMGRPVRVSASEDGSPGVAIVVPPVRARDFNFTSLSDAV